VPALSTGRLRAAADAREAADALLAEDFLGRK
jgi:hypothetical protein